MIIPLEELIVPLTVAQCKFTIYNVMARQGLNTTTWKPGAVVRTIVAACAIILAALSVVVCNLCRAGFLGLSSQDWLTVVAKYVYGVDREPATFGVVPVTFTNAGGGIYNPPAGKVTLKNSTTGKLYKTTETLTLNGLGTVSINVRAVEAGSASNAGVGAIDTIMSPRMLKVSCRNATSLVASDEESDPSLQLRCSEKLATLSPNGPPGAYSFYAKAATRLDGTRIGVTRTRVVTGPGDASCHMYVATDSGPVTGDVNDRGTDLGALYYYVFTRACPPGGTLVLLSTSNVVCVISYIAYCFTTVGKTEQQLRQAIDLALQNRFKSYDIGGNRLPDLDEGFVFKDDVEGTIKSAAPDDIFHVIAYCVQFGVPLAPNEVPVLGVINASINMVTRQ